LRLVYLEVRDEEKSRERKREGMQIIPGLDVQLAVLY
jgi:hypothetical protein